MNPLATRLSLIACLICLVVPAAASARELTLGAGATTATEVGTPDGIVSPGETVDLTQALISSENSTVSGLTGTLTATSTGTDSATITQGTSAYPSLTPGQSATNTNPFNLTLDNAMACGRNVPLSLALSNGTDTATVPFTLGTGVAGAPVAHEPDDLPLPIAQGGFALSSFTVDENGRVKAIKVRIGRITHPNDSDLVITLIAPDGTRVTLANRRGGDGDNYVNTVFSDDASQGIASASAPFTGSFKPEGKLNALIGTSQQGTWSLEVDDKTPDDDGTLESWGADLSPATCTAQLLPSFSVSPSTPTPASPVSFDASATTSPGATITNYEWDFDNDGIYEETHTTPTASHVYPFHTSATVNMRATDSHGATAVTTKTFAVTQSPTAAFTAPSGSQVDATTSFDGSASSDPDGSIASYEWDLDGNGSFETSSATPTIDNVYASPGDYDVRLRVIDDDGATSTVMHTVTILPSGPQASFTAPSLAYVGEPMTLDASASTAPAGSPHYEWDLDGNGSYETDGGSSPTLQHTFNATGSIDVGLQLTDAASDTGTATKTIVVTHRPVADLTATPNPARPGESVTLDASASTDADVGPLAKYEWDLDGNGSFERDTGTTSSTTQAFIEGTHTVTVRITDSDGATATKPVDVTAHDDAPTAVLSVGSNPTTGIPVTFDATGSADTDGTVAQYDWDLDGNGTFETTTGIDPHAARTYPNPGSITVHVRVTDNEGATGTAAKPLTIIAAPSGGGTGGGGSGSGTGTTTTTTDTGSTTTQGSGTTTTPGADAGTTAAGGDVVPAGPFTAGLSGASIQKVKQATAKGLGLTCTADRSATCTVTAQVSAGDARKLHLAKGKKKGTVALGSAKVSVKAGANGRLVLHFTAKVRKALRKARNLRVTVQGSATAAAGGEVKLSRVVLLRR